MKIGFLSYKDPKDRKVWSGGYCSMLRALENSGHEVIVLGPVRFEKLFKVLNLFNKLSISLFNSTFEYIDTRLVSYLFAFYFKNKIDKEKPDLIFAPAAIPEIANLKTEIPIAYYSDAVSSEYINYYPLKRPVSRLSKTEINILERRALNNADFISFSSQWAADSAMQIYSVSEDKIKVISCGANIPVPFDNEVFRKKKDDLLKLVFVGVDWERKGGSIAFDTMVELNKMGLKTCLTIIGCTPPHGGREFKHQNFINYPYLSLDNEDESKVFRNILLDSDFFILPTRAECAAFSFCEANAFGLPVFTTNTGGIASIITDGKNGYMLPLSSTGKDFAELIYSVFNNDKLYFHLRESSFQEYKNRLNWDTWANDFLGEIEKRGLINI